MASSDNYDEVASMLLLSDAELGLTFVRVACNYPEGPRRELLIRRAETAYQQIIELKSMVQMAVADRAELAERLERLRVALEDASCSTQIAPPGS